MLATRSQSDLVRNLMLCLKSELAPSSPDSQSLTGLVVKPSAALRRAAYESRAGSDGMYGRASSAVCRS
jgi:hypothetical protein